MNEKFSVATTVTVTLFLTLTLCVFGPVNIFFTNSLEFGFSFSAVLPYLLGLAVVVSLLIVGAVYLLRNRFYQESISFVFVSGLLLWIQGNLLVWNYGPFDGRDIHWRKMMLQGLTDFGIWVILIALAIWKAKKIVPYLRTAAMGFIAIQLLSASMVYFRAPEIPSFKRFQVDESAKFSFSTKKNVIVLLLDTYQSDLFQEIILEDVKYKELFRGFTYFRNNLSVFPKTYMSVPSFLTGSVYDNQETVQQFLKKAYFSNTSVPRVLKQNGYRVDLYPYPHTENTIYFDEAIASNIKKREPGKFPMSDLGLLLDISLFRQVPHFAKKFVYNKREWLIKRLLSADDVPVENRGDVPGAGSKDLELSKEALKLYDIQFLNRMWMESAKKLDVPVFKFFHLNGLHRPLVLDEALQVREMPYSQRSSFKSQGKACLEIVRLFFEKLKSLGIYNDSLIVVLGDHGCADYPYGVKIDAAGLVETGKTNLPGITVPSHIKAAGIPVLLIKAAGAGEDELKITDAPVSLKELAPTVLTMLGVSHGAPGVSMFNIPENEKRERYHYYYNWNGWEGDYLYSMRKYGVNGHAWLDSSWKELGIIRSADSKTLYPFGTEIRFERESGSDRYQGIGWHAAGKDGFTWTREKKAELYFYIDPPKAGLVLKLFMKPFVVPKKIDMQEVHVMVNGKEVQTLVLKDAEANEYSIVIGKEYITGPELNIVFDIPTAKAPAELNISTDVRTLGIALKWMSLEESE